MIKLAVMIQPDSPEFLESGANKYPTLVEIDGDNVSITLTGDDSKSLKVYYNVSTINVLDGVQIYVDPFDFTLRTLPWGDKKYNSFLNIGTILNVGDCIIIGIVLQSKDLLTTTYPYDEVDGIKHFKNYAYSFPSVKEAQKIRRAKYATIFNAIDIYSSVAGLEYQVDLLTNILKEIIQENSELNNKYSDYLNKILDVGSESVRTVTVNDIISSKQLIRDAQKNYFKLRDDIKNSE